MTSTPADPRPRWLAVVAVAAVVLALVIVAVRGPQTASTGPSPGETVSGTPSSPAATPSVGSTPTEAGSTPVASEPTEPAAPTASPAASPTSTGAPTATPTVAPTPEPEPVTLVGAGDIARCELDTDDATARLLDDIPGTIFTLGDNVYQDGTPEEFEACYGPTWGRHLDRTLLPAAGDHDWDTAGAAGYLGFFGSRAAPEGVTWYSRDLGAWHIVVLDAQCDFVGGCGEGSPQLEWLRSDLASNDRACILAISHLPRFSSGEHGSYEVVEPFWRVLYEAGADVVLSGDDHNYERFARQDPDGNPDPDRGIRQFVVGTGGTYLRAMGETRPNSEIREAGTHGVLRLELDASEYAWDFIPIAGQSFTDGGREPCT